MESYGFLLTWQSYEDDPGSTTASRDGPGTLKHATHQGTLRPLSVLIAALSLLEGMSGKPAQAYRAPMTTRGTEVMATPDATSRDRPMVAPEAAAPKEVGADLAVPQAETVTSPTSADGAMAPATTAAEPEPVVTTPPLEPTLSVQTASAQTASIQTRPEQPMVVRDRAVQASDVVPPTGGGSGDQPSAIGSDRTQKTAVSPSSLTATAALTSTHRAAPVALPVVEFSPRSSAAPAPTPPNAIAPPAPLLLAQIVPDSTLPTNSQVTTGACPSCAVITGGTRRGVNLYHSFQQFSIPTGGEAWFNNSAQIQNILTRVTGLSPSNIDGSIRANGIANLYLLNPNGIVFGPNASLNIGGSFVATTANSFRLPGGGEYGVTNLNQEPPLLRVNITPGVQYGAIPAGSTITNRGNLTAGQDLTLVADRLDLQGQLQAVRDLTLQGNESVVVAPTSQLLMGRNATISSLGTLSIPDSLSSPQDLTLVAKELTITGKLAAGQDLTLQGNESVSVDADSTLFSGRDMIIRSPVRILGNASYTRGGYFQTETLNGSLVEFLNPYQAKIIANGDVTVPDYEGPPLHILAGGKVTTGKITITGSDTETTGPTVISNGKGGTQTITVNSNSQGTVDIRAGVNWNLFPGGLPGNQNTSTVTPSFSLLPASQSDLVIGRIINSQGNVFLTNQHQLRPGQTGNLSSTDPIISSAGNVNIAANYGATGANAPSLLIESRGNVRIQGTVTIEAPATGSTFIGNDAVLGTQPGLIIRSGQTNLVYGGANQNTPPAFTSGVVPAGIMLVNPVQVQPNAVGGTVKLTADNGGITFHSINASSITGGNGGNIELIAKGDIKNTGSIPDPVSTISRLSLGSFSYLATQNTGTLGDAGNGGRIALNSTSGNIVLQNGAVRSSSSARSNSTEIPSGNAKNGGDISFTTTTGDITLSNFSSDSFSQSRSLSNRFFSSGNSGKGGGISFTTTTGNITLTNSESSSFSSSFSNSGKGGGISFTTTTGNITLTNSASSTTSTIPFSNSGKGGGISFTTTTGNITLTNSASRSNRSSNFDANGGAISFVTTNGDIALSNSASVSGSKFGRGAPISFTATNGNITLSNSEAQSVSGAQSVSEFEQGAPISFTTTNGNITLSNNSNLNSTAFSLGQGGAISFTTTNAGNISLSDINLDSSSQRGRTGGSISFAATGNITLSNANLKLSTFSEGGTAANGGAISFTTTNGDITLLNSSLNSSSATNFGVAGDGGPISLFTGTGNIILSKSSLFSYSFAYSGNAGAGGNISLLANSGNISGENTSLIAAALTLTNSRRSGAGGDVSLVAKNQISNLEIFTQSSSAAAGSIKINGTANLRLSNLQISTAKSVATPVIPNIGQPIAFEPGANGRSGDVTIVGAGNLTLDGTTINSNTEGPDRAGNISITTPGEIALQNNTQILTSTNDRGDAGKIDLNADQGIRFNNSQILSNTSSKGNAGSITLTAPVVSVTANSQIRAETQRKSSGSGGSIIINALNAVDLTRTADGIPVVSVESNGAGRAGSITINTPQLTLSDAAKITATATATSTNQEGGGSVTLNASNINLSGGTVGVFAQTQGQTPAGTLSLAPYADQSALNVLFTPGSIMSASTSSSGRGGNFNLTAPQAIDLSGPGTLSVETTGSGDAGSLSIATQTLNLRNGVQLLATTSNIGNGGNIGITANTVNLSQGARLSTTTSGSGQAGNIAIKFGDRFTLRGTGSNFNDLSDTGIYAGTTAGSTGDGGSIRIEAQPGTRPSITLRDGAKIAVNSDGIGKGGDIEILTPGRITLDNRAFVNATTDSGNGGNINIDPDLVLLRRNSQISTSAGRNRGGGDGGNITLTTGFLIGVLSENSDILANAYSGSGGNITINANSIFGFLKAPPGILGTPFSDLAASSQLGINGTIILNTLNIDPSKGLGELNLIPIDSSSLIAQSCATGKRVVLNENKFVVMGRSGLPASPEDVFRNASVLTELGTPTTTETLASSPSSPATTARTPSRSIVEAQALIIDANGKAHLVIQSPNVTPMPFEPSRSTCPQAGNPSR